MSIVFHGPSNKLGTLVYYSYTHSELGNLGGVILMILCPKIIVHPKNICKIHCSSLYYSIYILLIEGPSLKIPTLFTILFLFKLALFIIHTGVSFFLFSKFPSMKVR